MRVFLCAIDQNADRHYDGEKSQIVA